MAELEFEEILPFVEGEGDTGKTAREKINRNFTKIKPIANVGAEMQQLRQDVADDIEQLHNDVEEMVDKTTSLFGYYNCSTAGDTAAKSVQVTNYELTTGGNIRIKMEHANATASPVTLQIGNATAKQLYYNGEPVSDENTWEDNEVIVVYYDGTRYIATNSLGGGGGNGDAENIHYNNTESGLSATNVQDALDGIADKTQRLTTLDIVNTNLVNPAEVEQSYTLTDRGVKTGNQNYATSAFIPVEEGKTYTLKVPLADGTQGNAIIVCAFKQDYTLSSFYDTARDAGTYTVAVGNQIKYIRIVGASKSITGNTNADKLFGCFEGEGVTFKEWVKEESHQLQYNDGIPFADKDDDTLVNKGDVEAALTPLQEGIEELQDVKNVTDMFEKYSDVSPNLVTNPSTTIEPGYYALNGTYNNVSTFAHTDFIRIDPEKIYTVCAPIADGTRGYARFVAAFDENKQPFTGSQNAGGDSVIQYSVPVNYRDRVRYIVISGLSAGNKEMFGCFEGADAEYEEWYETVQAVLVDDGGGYDKKPLNAIVTKSDVIQAIEENKNQDVPSEGKMQFRYEAVATMHPLVNNLPAIKIYRDADNYMLVSLDKNRTSYYGGNHIFNFIAIRYNGVSSTVGDDVPPLMYYPSSNSLTDYGGNHAASVTRLNAPNHGLDNTDIGRTFPHSEGYDVVLMRVVDANYIIISTDGARPGTVPVGTVTIDGNVYDITNGDGATATSPYLCPVEQNLTQTILLNGKEEVTEDGDYTCDYLDIVEEYDVNMPTEILGVIKDRIKDGVGSSDNPSYETPDSFFHIRNTYRFLPNMGCLIFKTFTALTNINILACLGTQSTFPFFWKIGNNVTGTYIYLPNSTHNEPTITPTKANGYRSNENKYVSPTVWDDTIYLVVDSNTWADENNPVNRVICKTPPDAASQCGYVVGYDRLMGVGKSLGNFTDKPLNIAKLGKIYPYSIAGREVADGDTFTTVMYRMFFRPDLQPEGRICEYHYELNGKLVVYLDYSSSMNDVIVIDEKWDNKPIEVVESSNVTLLTDMYNGGIRVRSDYKNGETAFMVVRVG